jgi:hypothetical protein
MLPSTQISVKATSAVSSRRPSYAAENAMPLKLFQNLLYSAAAGMVDYARSRAPRRGAI